MTQPESTSQNFWTHQLTAHLWASWLTGYAVAVLTLFLGILFPLQSDLMGGHVLFDFYGTGFANALLLLLLTPLYVPIFGVAFKFKTPPLWAFVLLGMGLEYAIATTLWGGIDTVAGDTDPITTHKTIIAVLAGAVYGYCVHCTMMAKAQHTALITPLNMPLWQRTIPLWHKPTMMKTATASFNSILPAVIGALGIWGIFFPAQFTDTLTTQSPSLWIMVVLMVSVMLAVVFIILLLPNYLAIKLFEKFAPQNHRTLLTYGVFVLLGVVHVLALTHIPLDTVINTDPNAFSPLSAESLQDAKFTQMLWANTILVTVIMGYFYTRK